MYSYIYREVMLFRYPKPKLKIHANIKIQSKWDLNTNKPNPVDQIGWLGSDLTQPSRARHTCVERNCSGIDIYQSFTDEVIPLPIL